MGGFPFQTQCAQFAKYWVHFGKFGQKRAQFVPSVFFFFFFFLGGGGSVCLFVGGFVCRLFVCCSFCSNGSQNTLFEVKRWEMSKLWSILWASPYKIFEDRGRGGLQKLGDIGVHRFSTETSGNRSSRPNELTILSRHSGRHHSTQYAALAAPLETWRVRRYQQS